MPSTPGGEPGVDAIVGEPISLGVELAANVLIANIRERARELAQFPMERLQVRGLDAVAAGQLIDEEQ